MLVSTTIFVLTSLVLSASADPQQPLALQSGIIRACTKPNQAALTFDDGPYIYNSKISDTLKREGAVGTFFFNGNNWACIYDSASVQRVKAAYDAGHQVASHTWAHKDLNTLNANQLQDEMRRTEEAIARITGAYPAMTRPPYGNFNNLVEQVAGQRGQKLILWDFDSGDSVGATPTESKARYDDVVRRRPSNVLALNHETIQTTADDVLPYAIRKLKAAGYKLVSVAECTGQPAYRSVTAPSPRNSSWVC